MRIRLHEPADHAELAELRWRFTMEMDAVAGAGKAAFVERYRRHLSVRDRERQTVHWVAELDGGLVAVMTVRTVAREPAPGDPFDAWGYLTNVYVVPEARNKGLGTRLISAVKAWAVEAKFELLIVWPSERSRQFYARAGFRGKDDPLVLDLRGGTI